MTELIFWLGDCAQCGRPVHKTRATYYYGYLVHIFCYFKMAEECRL